MCYIFVFEFVRVCVFVCGFNFVLFGVVVRYRRLKKKAKERNAEKLIAEGMSNVDPEEAQSELEKAEALRAKVTLSFELVLTCCTGM